MTTILITCNMIRTSVIDISLFTSENTSKFTTFVTNYQDYYVQDTSFN